MRLNSSKNFISLLVFAWRIIYTVLYAIILLALAWYAFRVNDQGRDFFVGIVGGGISIGYIIKSALMLILWCLMLWYSTRIVLQVKRLEVPSTPFTRLVIKWLPRLIGILPFLIVINAHFFAASVIKPGNLQTLRFNTILLLAAAGILMVFFIYRKKIAIILGIGFRPDEERFGTGKMSLKELLAPKATRIAVTAIIVSVCLLSMLFFTPASWGFARMLKPATVVLAGLTFFTFIISLIILFIDIRRSPVFLLIGSYVVALSTCNNNNAIRTMGSAPKRMSIQDNFANWIAQRIHKRPAPDSVRSFPIFIVAAEGGGIRAAVWTSLVLKKLQELRPDFNEHLYAISGVSGGGVGAAFYAAFQYDRSRNEHLDFPSADSLFEQTVSDDFLSDLTAAFIFHDNLQRILPWPVQSLSRNRKLENSWGTSWRSNMFSGTMDSSFLQLWNNSSSGVPNILINGLLSETGQKAITSNIELSSPEFKDDIDVIGKLGKDMPLKTAASLGARFPVITSGALLKENDETPLGHILDGGYKENSGIETAWQLILVLDSLIRISESTYSCSIPVHILFIRNSTDGKTFNENYDGATKILPDISTIIPGFMNAWERRTVTHKHITENLLSNPGLDKRYKFIEIRLNNADRSLPLGWYLSDAARKNIISQADSINKTHPALQY